MDEIDCSRQILGRPEILVDPDRVTVGGRGLKSHSVDDELYISKDLGDIVHDKAFPLEVNFEISANDGLFIRGKVDCQVGLLRRQRLPLSPGSRTTHHAVIPVTAKHNLCRRFQDENWECTGTNEINLRKTTSGNVTWEYGLDISFSTKINSSFEGVTNVDNSFELVRPDFVCKKGIRIGVAVYQAKSPTKESVSRNPKRPIEISQAKLERIFGKPEEVHIYMGTITFADPTQPHIEYDMNSFTGCSGAIVFLLDQGQPEGVSEKDYGKAIAIHAGGHPTLANRNIAFKLSEEMVLAFEAQSMSFVA